MPTITHNLPFALACVLGAAAGAMVDLTGFAALVVLLVWAYAALEFGI